MKYQIALFNAAGTSSKASATLKAGALIAPKAKLNKPGKGSDVNQISVVIHERRQNDGTICSPNPPKTVWPKEFPRTNSHWATSTKPKPAVKKQLPI